jgi:hypothetical protein
LDAECFGLHHDFTGDVTGVDSNQEMAMSEPDLCASLQECQKLQTVRWAGTWQLAPRRAMSLLPRKNSQLLMVQGCAWITWDGPWDAAARRGGDHFLQAGQILDVPAGVRLVMQARHAHESLQFDWREMPPGLVPHRSPRTALPELLRQWGQAWRLLGGATVRLWRGLWRSGPGRAATADLPV